MDKFACKLLSWFEQSGRHDLPWQVNISPYRVWVSEIMLQQTQVNTVIPYYLRFMASFPTLADLAYADQDRVLHHWTGLGYYARARNLHKTAKIVAQDFNGELPPSLDELTALPGIGRSTAGAILAISMHQPATILDGNVKRVLARYHSIEGWPGKADVLKEFWRVAETHTPKARVADYTQAIMDLGATICTRSQPNCASCPISTDCLARKNATISLLPAKKPKKQLPVRSLQMLIFESSDGEILLERRPPAGIWGGLWSFPEAETDKDLKTILANMDVIEKFPDISNNSPAFRHTFSHYHLDIQPIHVKLDNQTDAVEEPGKTVCYDPDNPVEIGLAAPVKRLLKELRGSS